MANLQEKALQWVQIAGRGLVLENIPRIAKGMLNGYLAGDPLKGRDPVTLEKVLILINKNESLWNHINPHEYKKIQKFCG